MELTTVSSLAQRKAADVIILPFWQEEKVAKAAAPMKEFISLASFALSSGDFLGKEGEALFIYRGKAKEKRVLLLGLGKKAACSKETLRRTYATALKLCRLKKLNSINALLPHVDKFSASELCKEIGEGMLLANYSFDQLKGEKEELKPLVEKICLIGGDKSCSPILKKAHTLISCVNFTRDLVNGNADDVTPQALAKAAKDIAKEFSLVTTTVLDKKDLEKEKMGLLLAVNRGSQLDPAFIIMEYKGNPKSSDRTAIIGKGITYDTGGLNLKLAGGMDTMKCDMAGAACVLGTIRAAAALGLKKNLIGVIPSTENSIGSKSYKPGDVYRSFSGKTVEITDTDAEGRLVLADALAYTQERLKPTKIIDLATLTGGIVIALGEEATGLFSNDDTLVDALMKASATTSERLWRLPLYPEHKERLKSNIADIKNSGGRKASSSLGATFLERFLKKGLPWAHLDIAGTAYLSETNAYNPTPATGVGVRLLIEFLEHQND